MIAGGFQSHVFCIFFTQNCGGPFYAFLVESTYGFKAGRFFGELGKPTYFEIEALLT